MNTENKANISFREVMKTISTIISWTIFSLLVICAAFLLYYFIATKVFIYFGSKYEPKFSLYTIISPSMVPNINVYDVVIDIRVDKPEDIEIGDVITFYSDNPELHGSTITHRIISIIKNKDGTYSYQTKGDNNLVEDSSTVPFEKIVGRVAFRIPQLGRVQFFLASSMGWLLLLLIPSLYIIFKSIFKLKKLKQEDISKEVTPPQNSKLKKILTKPIFNKNKYKNVASPTSESITNSNYSANTIFDSYDDDISIDDLPKLK